MIGWWGGEGARLLELEGAVGKQEFGRLCDNLHPKNGSPLTARHKDDRTVGYDFTFSVPKSVSLLYALSEDERLLDAFRTSVRETMSELEAEMKVRARKTGQNTERLTGNMVWAEFVHHTSRPVEGVPDPQLHAHCFVFNATRDSQEDRWAAGYFRDLKRDAPYWQAAFRTRLANRLLDLGLELDQKKGDFEVAGIPAGVLKRFCRRTEKIEELAEKLGIEDPDTKAKLGATSREAKNASHSWPRLQQLWRDRLSPEELAGIEATLQRSGRPTPKPIAERDSVDFGLAHCFERDSVVPEKRLLAEALAHGLGTVSVAGVRRELASRQLIVREHQGQRLVTTPEVFAEEERLLEFARKGRGTRRPLAPDRAVKRDWLNAGQRKAIGHVLSSRDRVVLVRGVAGTGKTSLMQEAVEAIRESGHEVIVLAPSASASRDTLRQEGFADADTVARFLCDEAMQHRARGQVVWVDEAGLLGARDLARLFSIAERQDARVVLMGDRFQHSSPSRGAPLRLLEEQAGVPSVAVTEVMRQKGDYRKAVELLSQGKTLEGFDALDRLGWIVEAPARERYVQLAEAYLQATEKKTDTRGETKTALVVSPTHAEGELITQAIRGELKTRGKLGQERELKVWQPLHLTEAERGQASSYLPGDLLVFQQNAKGHARGERLVNTGQDLPLDQAARFSVYRPTTLRLAEGDRVRLSANGKTRDGRHRLNNGALHSVAKITPKGDVVLDNGWVVDRDRLQMAHGYTVTSHASQGKTVDTVIPGQSSASWAASGAEQFYVSASRGRDSVQIFTDDKSALREAVQRQQTRLSATELVGRNRARQRLVARHLSVVRRHAGEWSQRASEAERLRTPIDQRVHER